MKSAARGAAVFAALAIALAACSGGGGDSLTTIQDEGTIQISTDPNYEPQSFLDDNGELIGFDIDVAREIADRLGVEVEFVTPTFDLVQAGGWNGQWDVSVGSITVTDARKEVLDFTPPYYFTPAQLAATEASGIASIEDFAGKKICVGAATTYLDWINGDLVLGDGSELAPVPDGVEAVALETDALCAESIDAGRDEFDGWLSSSTTVAAAIDGGVPIVTVGDPVFYEPLAVATDKSGPDNDALQAELDDIINAMHEDGTLTDMSMEWYGIDITTKE
ncbi:MAG TPA: transporter substrate-binding domain-containing protein [Candidatus Limnocylindria bacterium]|nr:transporter substrate-binding domain-containing protein [Candidatus Limnocylindria bacterium]